MKNIPIFLLLGMILLLNISLIAQKPQIDKNKAILPKDLLVEEKIVNNYSTVTNSFKLNNSQTHPPTNKSITRVLMGSSANIYSVLSQQQNCLSYNNDLGLLMFTHQKSIPIVPPANSGNIQTSYSVDGGFTWNNHIVYANATKLGRFPSGVIYNPPGNSILSNCYAVVAGPYTDGAGWKGSYYASKRFDGQNASAYIIDEDEAIVGYTNLPRSWMDIDVTGRVRLMGEKNTTNGQQFTGFNTAIYTGTLNSGLNSWSWTENIFVPPYTVGTSGSPDGYKTPCMAWSKNGQTAYLIYVGRNINAVDPDAYHPIIYKTINGGISWMLQPSFDWNNSPAIQNNLMPTVNNQYLKRASFGMIQDAVVDAHGFLHFSVFINSAYSTHIDSLAYVHAWSNKQGLMYHVYQTPVSWNTDIIAPQWGLDVDVSTSFIGIPWDNRLQMSKTPDENIIVFAWLDTDTNFSMYNLYPDIRVQAFDINTGTRTPAKNLTKNTVLDANNFFMYLSNWSGFDSITNTVKLNISTTEFGSTATDPVDHYYIQGLNISILSATATAMPSAICEGSQSSLNVAVTGGSGTYTYAWTSNPVGFTSALQNSIVSPTITTTYTVTVTDGSQTSSASVTVFVNHVPGAAGNISGPSSVCEGSSNILFSVPPIPNAASYVWTVPYGMTISTCGTNSMLLNVLQGAASGLISVFGTNACGVGSVSTIPVTVNQSPIVVNAGYDQVITYLSTATLNGSATGGLGNYSYSWSPAVLLQNASVQNPTTIALTSSTIFELAVTDSTTGCTSTDNVHVYVAGGPPSCITIADPAIICQGASTILQAIPSGGSGSYTYSWTSNPPGFTSTLQNPNVSPTVTTQYLVEVSDGSQIVSASVTVQVMQLPGTLGTISGLTDVCAGTNNVVYSVPTAPAITNYFWNLPAGATVISGQNTNSIIVNFASNAASGNITVGGWSACGCVPSDTLVVTLYTSPVADAGPNQNINCGGTPVTIGTTAVGGMVYSWSPSYALSNTNIAQPTAAPWGNTTYILTVTDALSGCYATDSVSVTVNGAPIANAGSDQPINCGGPGVVIGSAHINGMIYSWTPANGLSDDSIAQPIATPLTTTNYNLTVVDIVTGCFDTDDVMVTVNAGPTSDAGLDKDVNCVITCVAIGTAAIPGLGYSWTPSNGLSNANLAQPTACPLSSTVYTLTVTDSITGCYNTDNVTVTVSAAPIADAGPNQTINSGDIVSLNGSATGGSGNYSYFWVPDTLLQNPNIPNPTTVPLSSPVVFTLLVTDNVTGCTASDSVLIDFNVSTEYLSESFTVLLYPNPTTGNITVEINNKIPEQLILMVFNTLGQLVYETNLDKNNQTICLKSLTDGLYIITLRNSNFILKEKLIIQKTH